MNNKNVIKIEMAQLAFKGKRYDEAEKILTDVIFSDESDDIEKSIAWIAIGSVKSSKFLINEATIDEISYCFTKARQLGNLESDTLYANEIMILLWDYHSTIKALQKKLIEIEKNKWSKAFTAAINTTIAENVSWNNSHLKIGMLGSAVSSSLDYYSDKIIAENIPDIINELTAKASFVIEKFQTIYEFSSDDAIGLVSKFIDEHSIKFNIRPSTADIFQNEIVLSFLEYKTKIGSYYIREGNELEELVKKPLEKISLDSGEVLLFGVCTNYLYKKGVDIIITNKRLITTITPSFSTYCPIDKSYFYEQLEIEDLKPVVSLFSTYLIDEKNKVKISIRGASISKEFLDCLGKLIIYLKSLN
jgi:hypothetical protein